MRTKNTKTTTEVSAEDRRRVQGIADDDEGGSGSTTEPMYWQQQRSVDFPCYRVANSNTFSSLSSCCLVLKEILSVLQSCRKYFFTKYCSDELVICFRTLWGGTQNLIYVAYKLACNLFIHRNYVLFVVDCKYLLN